MSFSDLLQKINTTHCGSTTLLSRMILFFFYWYILDDCNTIMTLYLMLIEGIQVGGKSFFCKLRFYLVHYRTQICTWEMLGSLIVYRRGLAFVFPFSRYSRLFTVSSCRRFPPFFNFGNLTSCVLSTQEQYYWRDKLS